ncbi:MAG: PQQ-binding-like beta-propeller repeat protein [candidate division WOR-3 bacterium]|nr:PQQ-binding-like beta-propeller repeat protein [candidate division WOR-3 bacterium]
MLRAGGWGPAIGEDGTVYISGSLYNEITLKRDDYLYAINPDGSFKWRFPVPRHVAPPTVGSDGNIYFGAYYTVYAVDPNGNLKWKVTAAKKSTPGSKGTDAWILASLAIDNKGIAYL